MSGATDADRERAMRVMAWDPLSYAEFVKAVNDGGHPDDRDALEMVDTIAQALADERERARAPFLHALDVIDDGYFAPESYDRGVRWAADRIRQAARDGQP